MIHVRSDLGRIVPLHPNGSVHGQRALGELRMPAHHKFPPLRGRLQEDVADEFAIERQIAYMHCRLDYWSIHRSGSLQREVCAALDWQLVQVNLSNSRKIKILAREVEPESACRR